ncbi:hypothetical protein OQJ65_17150 [Vibrio sp. Sgm 22]|uniref:hypothetical protein n=1 Tax=unclassified Vibrio TaxID=2614977 RepID=UPI002248D618|nr:MULTISPECIES: hypothetical protein [unclassified Vibrio]MCX2760063.1 hypothetical protein [Vibrio sp. 14G-20]MCX2777051.1 hypothetical protein [Vibrio sp. Sgm 22]
MKTLLIALTLVSSFASVNAFAHGGGGTGGVPVLPCFIGDDYHGTISIVECENMRSAKEKLEKTKLPVPPMRLETASK